MSRNAVPDSVQVRLPIKSVDVDSLPPFVPAVIPKRILPASQRRGAILKNPSSFERSVNDLTSRVLKKVGPYKKDRQDPMLYKMMKSTLTNLTPAQLEAKYEEYMAYGKARYERKKAEELAEYGAEEKDDDAAAAAAAAAADSASAVVAVPSTPPPVNGV